EAAHGNSVDDLFQHVLRHRAHHVGLHIAGGQGVDGDADGGAFQGQGLGETVDTGLGGGVVHLAVLAGLAVEGADVDDAAEAALAHAVDHRAAHVEAGAEVGVDHRLPAVRAHAVKGGVAGDAGVVDEDVDGAVLPDRKSTRLDSSHVKISYAVFCLKK